MIRDLIGLGLLHCILRFGAVVECRAAASGARHARAARAAMVCRWRADLDPLREPYAATGKDAGRDRGDQRPDSNGVHDACEIIGEDRECHLGSNFRKRFGQEVRRAHASFDCTERMFALIFTPTNLPYSQISLPRSNAPRLASANYLLQIDSS